jgi:hypothetical protein
MSAELAAKVLEGAALLYFDGRLTEPALKLAAAARAAGGPSGAGMCSCLCLGCVAGRPENCSSRHVLWPLRLGGGLGMCHWQGFASGLVDL